MLKAAFLQDYLVLVVLNICLHTILILLSVSYERLKFPLLHISVPCFIPFMLVELFSGLVQVLHSLLYLLELLLKQLELLLIMLSQLYEQGFM